LERVVDRKALGRWWFVAAALGIAGSVLLVATSDEHPVASQTATMIGVLLGLVAGASYATYSWDAQRLMTKGLGRAAEMGSVFGLEGVLMALFFIETGSELY